VGLKKTKGKSKSEAKKPAKKSGDKTSDKTSQPKAIGEVRENISELVRDSANEIANELITIAKAGQLASARYLFEVVGLYPPTEQTASKPDDSLAHVLLKRMGLPIEPVIREEDEVVATFPVAAKEKAGEPPDTAADAPEPRGDEEQEAGSEAGEK